MFIHEMSLRRWLGCEAPLSGAACVCTHKRLCHPWQVSFRSKSPALDGVNWLQTFMKSGPLYVGFVLIGGYWFEQVCLNIQC